jgi:formamidopyrimidine-DNA glycosylase
VPELPEVETLRRSLEPHLVGATIIRARLIRPDICRALDGEGNELTPSSKHLLAGLTIERLSRRGKQMAITSTNGRVLVVQLGMSGQMLITAGDAVPEDLTHVHAVWTLPNGMMMFRDPRRFGGLTASPSQAALESTHWKNLGSDALTMTDLQLQQAAGSSSRAIKAVLLDQSVVAGIGNIYADELLFLAGVAPQRASHSLGQQDWVRIGTAMRSVLRAAVDARGSSIRDYVDATGVVGSATLLHRVYGRGGEPCLTCKRELSKTTITQRTTVWCSFCQS